MITLFSFSERVYDAFILKKAIVETKEMPPFDSKIVIMDARTVIRFPHSAFGKKEAQMNKDRRFRVVVSDMRRSCRIATSSHVLSHIFFPTYLSAIQGEALSSQSSLHAFDAIYRNAMDYLDKINQDESFQ